MFDTNVTGLINMTQAVLPAMKARNGGAGAGDIINIGSIAGREPYQGGSIYCATKAAVRSFTDAMRRELIATRIRVIEVDPGQVETEFSVVRFYGDKSKADKVYEGVDPLTPDDIAEVVVFAAGRKENVVLADSLIFPNHQVRPPFSFVPTECWALHCEGEGKLTGLRLRQQSCTDGHEEDECLTINRPEPEEPCTGDQCLRPRYKAVNKPYKRKKVYIDENHISRQPKAKAKAISYSYWKTESPPPLSPVTTMPNGLSTNAKLVISSRCPFNR